MKLAFDADSILSLSHSGIGWSAFNLMKAVATLNQSDELRLQYFIPPKEYNEPAIEELRQLGYDVSANSFPGSIYKMIWRFIPLSYSRFFGNSDSTCFFNFHLPPGVKGKKVVFVHDMTYKKYPETVRLKTKTMLKLTMGYTMRHADIIIAVSEFTKSEIIKYYNFPEDRIEVIYNAVDTDCFHTGYTGGQTDAVKKKYGIDGEYFLYLGTLEPRKNIEGMLKAYKLFKQNVPDGPAFVLAGAKGWLYESIFQLVQKLELEQDVIFTGYIDQADSPLLMRGALAFLFVSLYEGFGMPPLEAMACGVPVLTSDTASLPEATGGRALYANPLDVHNIAQGMQRLSEDAELRRKLSKDGLERAKNFSWEKSARKLLDIMRDI